MEEDKQREHHRPSIEPPEASREEMLATQWGAKPQKHPPQEEGFQPGLQFVHQPGEQRSGATTEKTIVPMAIQWPRFQKERHNSTEMIRIDAVEEKKSLGLKRPEQEPPEPPPACFDTDTLTREDTSSQPEPTKAAVPPTIKKEERPCRKKEWLLGDQEEDEQKIAWLRPKETDENRREQRDAHNLHDEISATKRLQDRAFVQVEGHDTPLPSHERGHQSDDGNSSAHNSAIEQVDFERKAIPNSSPRTSWGMLRRIDLEQKDASL